MASEKSPQIHFSFDVGHSSIGWAAFQTQEEDENPNSQALVLPELLGCGAVTFGADDCLASKRRDFRRARRHIRSTRQRINRMKLWLEYCGVLTKTELGKPGCAWPWLLAAQVLANGKTLTWHELWDVLRWYGHNRGYDGNRRWSGEEESKEDSEKEKAAIAVMQKHGTSSMAETLCKELGLNPKEEIKASQVRFKGLGAAFPREIVEKEVRKILEAHVGKLKVCDAQLIHLLMARELSHANRDELQKSEIYLPLRYEGGLLFGQLVPRFDNRIISICPVSGEKVPTRNCPEFLNFRWGMQLANIRVAANGDKELRPLTPAERKAIDDKARREGHLTPTAVKKAVQEVSGCERNNLETMFMHPDAKEALLLDPLQRLISSEPLGIIWHALSENLQKRLRGKLRLGKALSLGTIREWLDDKSAFDFAIQEYAAVLKKKGGKKAVDFSVEGLLKTPLKATQLSQRAAYSRSVLKKAYEEVMEGKHPKEEGGCLFVTEKMREAQMNREIAEQTNNHLVRHRLLILERLHEDILKEYAGGDLSRIGKVTVEVNRDLREMSGKTAKEKAQDLGQRLANFKGVVKKLEEDSSFMNALRSQGFSKIPVGMIRKARIAEDLGWKCPYTGHDFEPVHLLTKQVDKDHIVPRSERASDSLNSLVMTFSEVNRWKGKRTAMQFIADEEGKLVPGKESLMVMTVKRYREFVEKLESFKGHDDDKRRKKKRKELMLLASYDEPEFTPGDLTKTSQIVRLGAQLLKRAYLSLDKQPQVVSMPGSVTGALRKGWNKNLLGCLSSACPQVLDANGEVKTKTDIRDITHLHHALDACVLGLATRLIPNSGRVWELIVKRKLSKEEQNELRFSTRGMFWFDVNGNTLLRELPKEIEQQIRKCLMEKRVVQHIPARINGLRVEQNTWRVLEEENGEVTLEQRIRQTDGSRPRKITKEKAGKLMGLQDGKLKALKGALVIPDNFGVALDPVPTIIPYHKVWTRIQELKAKNGGKMPRILRNGMIIEVPKGTHKGTWRIFSVKNNSNGVSFSLGEVDCLHSNKSKQNVLIRQLIKDGMVFKKTYLIGTPLCPTISSI